MRCDSLAWACALLYGNNVYSFRGIRKHFPSRMEVAYAGNSWVAAVLMHDDLYMDKLHWEETEMYMSSDWDDEYALYLDGHEDDARVLSRVEWASDRAEWSQLTEYLTSMCEDVQSLAAFLREHPVDGVYVESDHAWVDLDDVVAYCPNCQTPTDEVLTGWKPGEAPPTPHVATDECEVCDAACGSTQCLFDKEGKWRPLAQCPSCREVIVLFSSPEEGTYTSFCHAPGQPMPKLPRKPLTWPPGAPYPPRRGFAGEPFDVPPYEK